MSIAKVKLATGNSCQNDISPSRKTYSFCPKEEILFPHQYKNEHLRLFKRKYRTQISSLEQNRVVSALSGKFKTI